MRLRRRYSMYIQSNTMVSTTEITINYNECKKKADAFGKVFIFKNNQPDAVLYSIKEYTKISILIEYMENLDDEEVVQFINSLPKQEKKKFLLI